MCETPADIPLNHSRLIPANGVGNPILHALVTRCCSLGVLMTLQGRVMGNIIAKACSCEEGSLATATATLNAFRQTSFRSRVRQLLRAWIPTPGFEFKD